MSSIIDRNRLLASLDRFFYFTDAKGLRVNVNSYWKRMSGLNLLLSLGEGRQAALHSADKQQVLKHWKLFID